MGEQSALKRRAICEVNRYRNPCDKVSQPVFIQPGNCQCPTIISRGTVQRQVADITVRDNRVPLPQTDKEKLQHGALIKEGLILSRGTNGELLATVENTANNVAFGYVRKNGAYSRAVNPHLICEQLPGQTNRLVAVTQSETFSARVTHNGEGRTTIALTVDPSLAAFHIKLGDREYLLKASEIEEVLRTNPPTAPIAQATTSTDQPVASSSSLPRPEGGKNLLKVTDETRVYDPALIAESPRIPLGGFAGNTPFALGSWPRNIGGAFKKTAGFVSETRGRIVNLVKRVGSSLVANHNQSLGIPRSGRVVPSEASGLPAPANHLPNKAPKVYLEEAPRAVVEAPRGSTTEHPLATQSANPRTIEAEPTSGRVVEANQQVALKESFKAWRKNLSISEFARQNPVKAMALAIAVSEAVTGALSADYSDNATHSPVPKLLKWLNKDIGAQLSFSTEESGLMASIAAEGASSAGDALIGFGVFSLAEKSALTLAASRYGAIVGSKAAVGMLMRSVGIVAGAYHGFSNFADGRIGEMTDLQMAGNTAGPALTGAIFGAPFGPVGAVLGAVVGIAGEGVGIYVGFLNLDEEIGKNWKQREVYEALRLALLGFTLPSDSEVVKKRKALKDLPNEHQTVIKRCAQNSTLWNLSALFNPEEINKLGFRRVSGSPGTKSKQLEEVTLHNIERMKQLTEGGSWGRFFWGDYIDQLSEQDNELAKKFIAAYTAEEDQCMRLYNHAPHLTYEVQENGIKSTSELMEYLKALALDIDLNLGDKEILERLIKALPDIETIVATEHGREMLIHNLERHSGNTGRFRDLVGSVNRFFEKEGL